MEAVSAAVGVKVRVTPSLARLTVPAMALPPEGVTVIELLVTDVGLMSLLICARHARVERNSGLPVSGVDGAHRERDW